MSKRIHIFGASGSGTTTLAKALSKNLHCHHFDTDRYFWLDSDPPFKVIRERTERQRLLNRDLTQTKSWVLSGSLCGWGDFTIPMFDLVIFLWLPMDIRMERLRLREQERYGPQIDDPNAPGYSQHMEFITWAASYDSGDPDMRSKACHENWIATLPCPVIRIERDIPVEQKMEWIMSQMNIGLSNRFVRTLPL